MRVLFSAPPSIGHIFPMVPIATALRAAGHDVLLAGYGGEQEKQVYTRTGLPIVDIGDGFSLAEAHARFGPPRRFGIGERSTEAIMTDAGAGFSELCRRTIDPLFGVVDAWRPDVMVNDPFQAAVPLVAAARDIPVVENQFGIVSGSLIARIVRERLADSYRQYGVSDDPSVVRLEVVTPSVRAHRPESWPMRCVPFNGPGTLPLDLLERGEQARVLVTLGTVLSSHVGVQHNLSNLIKEAGEIDAEFLLAMGDNDISVLGALPENVRVVPWLPLSELLRTCDGIVHHGGSGTMLSAIVQSVPQLMLPQGADQYVNANAAMDAGFGIRTEPEAVDADLLNRLLTDHELTASARRVRAENEAQPSPAEVVGRFEQLAAR